MLAMSTWENLGEFHEYREPPVPTIHTRKHARKRDENDKRILGPKGEVLRRVVDRRPRSGFKREADR